MARYNREVTVNDERKLPPIVSQIRLAMKENRRARVEREREREFETLDAGPREERNLSIRL